MSKEPKISINIDFDNITDIGKALHLLSWGNSISRMFYNVLVASSDVAEQQYTRDFIRLLINEGQSVSLTTKSKQCVPDEYTATDVKVSLGDNLAVHITELSMEVTMIFPGSEGSIFISMNYGANISNNWDHLMTCLCEAFGQDKERRALWR